MLTAPQQRALEFNARFDDVWLTASEMLCSGSAAHSLVRQGLLVQRPSARSLGYEYRITAAGLKVLDEAGFIAALWR